jgi:CDGSH-type Zn-finger protein
MASLNSQLVMNRPPAPAYFTKQVLGILILVSALSACQNQGKPGVLPGGATTIAPGMVTPTESITITPAPATVEVEQPTATVVPTTTSVESPTPTQTPKVTVFPFHGIQISGPNSANELPLVSAAGARWSRENSFRWDKIEPARTDPPTYKWEAVNEKELAQAASAGIQMVATVQFTPAWAQKHPGHACGPISEQELPRFGQFLAALVSRYSQPPYNVRYWELGNEPDVDWNLVPGDSVFGCWGEAGEQYYGGEYFAAMLKTVYPLIKAADPQAQVLVGGLLLDCNPDNPPPVAGKPGEFRDCSPGRFLEGILNAGGGDYFDGVSFHAYDFYPAANQVGHYTNGAWFSAWDKDGPVLGAKVSFLRGVLEAYSHPEKYLINTEVALICGRSGNEPFCRGDSYANTKAYYVAQASAVALAAGLRANIWYSLSGWRGSGLVSASLQPEPAYTALQFSATMLHDAKFSQMLEIESGVKGYEFSRGDERLWLIWSIDGQDHRIKVPGKPSGIWDVFGKELPIDQELVVGLAPVYVTWEP